MSIAPLRSAATPTVRVWAASESGKPLRHPGNGRAPGERPDGVSVPDDAFTARRIVDGDWTTVGPAPKHSATSPVETEAPEPKAAKPDTRSAND